MKTHGDYFSLRTSDENIAMLWVYIKIWDAKLELKKKRAKTFSVFIRMSCMKGNIVNIDTKLLDLDDEFLMSQIQEGSHEAFSTLVGRHSNRFYRTAYRLVSSKDDAEDIVQEGFLKLWNRPNL